MNKGFIIVGYQGIGKSTMAGKENCIDLESGNFWVGVERYNAWYKIYANMAEHLAKQGYIVFTASHKVFRDELRKRNVDFVTVSPSITLKDAWIDKLEQRYNRTKSEKDYKAWQNAINAYAENVEDLQSEEKHWVIKSMDYKMADIVESIKNMFDE